MVLFRITLSGLEGISEIFNDTKHRAATLRQPSFLLMQASCFGKLLPKPKLCSKFEVVTFSGCRNKYRVPKFLDAPLAQPSATFGPKSCKLYVPKLCTKRL